MGTNGTGALLAFVLVLSSIVVFQTVRWTRSWFPSRSTHRSPRSSLFRNPVNAAFLAYSESAGGE
jgi:hypothetical protein